MEIGKVSSEIGCPACSVNHSQPKPLPVNSSQSSITSLETPFTKEPPRLQVLCEDILGFCRNLFCWPIHGTMILSQQMLLLVFLPVIFPLLILEFIVQAIVTFFSICFGKSIKELFGPTFYPREPTQAEAEVLKALVERNATISEKQQLQLLHLLDTYFEFSKKYTGTVPNTTLLDTIFPRSSAGIAGKEHTHFNSLIKVDIDGVPQLFQHSPSHGKIFGPIIKHITKHAQVNSQIRFTFIGIDYSYFIGLLKMKISTDVVKFQVKDETLELELKESGENKSCLMSVKSLLLNLFNSWIVPKNPPQPYDHVREVDQRALDFSLWPGTTRRICADLINSSLNGAHLSEYQISLLDLSTIIRP